MNLERLTRLKQIMADVRDAQRPFDLGNWINSIEIGTGVSSAGVVGDVTVPEACGTTCCALGYAALDPEFRKAGLQIMGNSYKPGHKVVKALESVADFNTFLRASTDEDGCPMTIFNVTFDRYQGSDAGSAFFDISEKASKYLFFPESYRDNGCEYDECEEPITPDEVIAHINEVIAYDGRMPYEG